MSGGRLAIRAGRWSAAHRKLAMLLWLGLVVGSLVLGGAIGTRQLASDQGGTGSSGRANQVLHSAFPQPAQEDVLVQAVSGRHDLRPAVADVIARLRTVPQVGAVRSPYAHGARGQISGDGRSALVQFNIRGPADKAQDHVQGAQAAVAAAQREHPDLRIAEFGAASADRALSRASQNDLHRAETLSLPITLLILIVVFGALVAASVPVLLALTAVAAALGLVAIPSHLTAFDPSASAVMVLIGMAVGVDYALFYVRREREERRRGRSAEEALETAAATAGRAVLVSGTAVMIAMAGMFVVGNATFTSFAVGTMIVVAAAMIGSVTFLPAVLSALGDRIDRGRIPGLARLAPRPARGRGSLSAAILRPVLARPRMAALVSVAALVALGVPALSLHTLNPGVRSVPANLPVMKTYQRIQAAFPGSPGPALVVVQARDVMAPPVRDAIGSLEARALRTGQMSGPMSVTVNRAHTVAVTQIALAGDGTDTASNRALGTLRGQLIPSTLGRVPGVKVNVTGDTATSSDFSALLSARTPLVFVFVLGLAFVFLLLSFDSVVIPLTAIVLNLLSVFAGYGVIELVFQHHWADSLLGFTSIGGVSNWLPLMMFVILFGLSMDYHVLILSRIREARGRGLSTREAVAHGISSSAGVVTSAAAVMVAVFSIFASLSQLEFKEFGVGLAVAILIDATVIRTVLLPAVMTLLGERNWWAPSALRRRARERSARVAPRPVPVGE
ncbi:MAG TPA: MMPL family transporter [Solirubrobacteraceae bacterium]|nr:MMPL family transporter [Solirubrobacteraceae bacterium]